MDLRTTLLASAASAAVLAIASPVQAGGYVSVFGGWNITDDIKSIAGSNGDVLTSFSTTVNHVTGGGSHPHTLTFNFTAPSTFFNSGAKAEDGWVLGAAVGGDLSWFSGLRAEFEASYRRNSLGPAVASAHASDTDTDSDFFAAPVVIQHSCGITPVAPLVAANPPPAPCTATAPVAGTYAFRDTLTTSNAFASGSGTIRTFALMANVWYDIPMSAGFTPYLGGGIGYADSEVEHGAVMNGSGGDFAWQLGAGVNFAMTEKMSLGIGYRYMDAGDVTLVRAPALATGNKLVTDEHEVTHQSVLVNLTFHLGK